MITFSKAERKPPKRRFIDTPSHDEWWSRSHKIADLAYPLLATAFTNAVDEWRRGIEPLSLFEALIGGNLLLADQVIEFVWTRQVAPRYLAAVQPIMRETFARAAEASIPHLTRVLAENAATEAVQAQLVQIGIQFGGPASPRVISHVQQYAAQEIRFIGESSRQAIRTIIQRHYEQGLSPTQMARDIRQFIGLTDKQAAAVERFRQTMIEAKISPANVERRVQSRVNRMIRDRAKVIARNESHALCQEAHYQIVLEQARDGLLDEDRARRFWIVTPGSRTCKYCRPVPGMNPDGVRLREPFKTPLGPSLIAHLHITCRCAEGLRFID